MEAPETPKPQQPKQQSLQSILENMDKIKTDFFDAIKVITDDYEQSKMINSLTYGSYHANRGYGMSSQTYGKMMGWNQETINQYEAAYQSNIEREREENRYRKIMKDLDLIK